MAASAITWTVEADPDFDSSFGEDLRPRITQLSGGYTLVRGMNDDGLYQTSQVSFSLRNDDGRFTPDVIGGALEGKVKPGLPVRFKANHNSIDYDLWTGYFYDVENTWRAGKAGGAVVGLAHVMARDISAFLQRNNGVNVLAAQSRRTDQGIQEILTELGLTAGQYSLDVGQHTMPFHFVRNGNGLRSQVDCALSEMGGLLYILSDGRVRFESRASRSGVASPDHTWGEGTEIKPSEARWVQRALDTVAKVQVQATIYQSEQLEQEALRFQRGASNQPADSLTLIANQVWEGEINYDSAVITLTTPEANIDYLANSAIDGSGSDQTSNLEVTVTDLGGAARVKLRNLSGSTIYITYFRLRAVTVVLGDSPIFVSAKSVPNDPSDGEFSITLPYSSDTNLKAQDYSMQLLRTHRYPVPRLILHFKLERHDDIAASLLGAELGDLVYYDDQPAGVTGGSYRKDWFYIERLEFALTPGKPVNDVRVMLLPSYSFRDLDAICYDLFNRSTGLTNALSRHTWTGDTANFALDTNRVRVNTVTSANCIFLDPPLNADMVVESDLVNLTGGQGRLGVAYRVQDKDNYLCAYIDEATNQVVLAEVVADVFSTLDSASVTNKTSYELKVVAQGTRHRVWVDHVLLLDVTETTYQTETGAGLMFVNTNSTNVGAKAGWDDFYAQGL